MNTTTLNMTTLDGGNVIIKKGEGGGATINNQDKVVDITENGTTEVVADGGYTGLGKVTINTEVSGGESASTIEYLDVSGNMFLADVIAAGIVEMKITVENSPIPIEGVIGGGIVVFRLITELKQMGATVNIIAVSYNRDAMAVTKQDGVVTTQTAHENLASRGETYVEAYNNIPRITKEQFYSLD